MKCSDCGGRRRNPIRVHTWHGWETPGPCNECGSHRDWDIDGRGNIYCECQIPEEETVEKPEPFSWSQIEIRPNTLENVTTAGYINWMDSPILSEPLLVPIKNVTAVERSQDREHVIDIATMVRDEEWFQPIIVEDLSEMGFIIDGHHRLLAMEELGADEIYAQEITYPEGKSPSAYTGKRYRRNASLRYTAEEYNNYVSWVLYAVLGGLGEADDLMRRMGGPIRSMAKKLVAHLGVPSRPVWRALLLEPGEVPPNRLIPPQLPHAESVSWSEDKGVACFFADTGGRMSTAVMRIRPRSRGWMMKIAPKKADVLWHWSWKDHFPAPGRPGTIDLAFLAQYHPYIGANIDQFKWSLETQKEVILRPLNREVMIVPYEDAECPPREDLDKRLGGCL